VSARTKPMSVAGELVGAAARLAEHGPLPRVRALHVPPPHADRTRAGEFCALELEGGVIGLSYVLIGDTLARLRSGEKELTGAGALEVARWFAERTGAERAIGLAAVNALSALLFQRAGWTPDAAGDTIGELSPAPGDEIGMIGLFPPLVPRITKSGARLTVVELRPELAAEHDGWRVTLDGAALRRCGKVLSTSTVLLNDTLDEVLAMCANARVFAMVGPGAGMVPDPLFARGVTLVGGAWVTDPAALLDAIRSGAPWGASARKSAIARDRYPGIETLLDRDGTARR
jgi:uncharacterized protein (DUF4213/DUF364 family)